MIIVSIKKGKNIECTFKRYKRKHNDIDIVRRLRKFQAFQKPSNIKHRMMGKTYYVQSFRQEELDT